MKMIKSNLLWFTLVELIVVSTILVILWMIWFVSYSSYLEWVRDTNRITQLTNIHDWLDLSKTKWRLPLPDDNVRVEYGDDLLWYQWYAWTWVLETIDFIKLWKDPLDWIFFTYYLDDKRKRFQLLSFLEEEWNTQFLLWWWINTITQASAEEIDYWIRYPFVMWRMLWVLTNENNTPLQELTTTTWLTSAWKLDLNVSTDNFIAHFKSWDNYTGSWSDLSLSIKGWNSKSCKDILNSYLNTWDWVYKINPTWGNLINVYCDMSTDWGGWTLFWINANNPTKSPKDFFDWFWNIESDIDSYSNKNSWSIWIDKFNLESFPCWKNCWWMCHDHF